MGLMRSNVSNVSKGVGFSKYGGGEGEDAKNVRLSDFSMPIPSLTVSASTIFDFKVHFLYRAIVTTLFKGTQD